MYKDLDRKGNHKDYGHGRHNRGEAGFCFCPLCGFSVMHKAGIPCRILFCPVCKVLMQRSDMPQKETGSTNNKAQSALPDAAKPAIQFPRVDAEKCTACGICIDICPTGTIVIENGKAYVKTENCRICRICMRACPENAFIME
ncbi:MAG: 4Fe-4S binding protein [Bacteroidota bacterium]